MAAGLKARERIARPELSGEGKANQELLIKDCVAPSFGDTPPSHAVPCGVCWKCIEPLNLDRQYFIVCAICGCKRCPHAQDCANECTGSNAVGQVAKRRTS